MFADWNAKKWSMIDFREVLAFQTRLRTAADTRRLEEDWVDEESGQLADVMRSLVPVRTGRLRDSITETDDGVAVTADYSVFVEYGTIRTAPQPYVRPAIQARTRPAVENLSDKTVRRMLI